MFSEYGNEMELSGTPFSVSMCVYGGDHPEHFKVAIDSILNQTICPNEVVLVVDGPVPVALGCIIDQYRSMEQFHVIQLATNTGHGYARRVGLENCQHELVALMDADDISVPTRFQKQLSCFQSNPSLAIVGGIIEEFTGTIECAAVKRVVPFTDAEIKQFLRNRCPMNQVSVMFRKSIVQSVGGYQDWYCNEDYYLWIRLFQAGAVFANLPDTLVHVRTGADMYQRRGGWKYFVSEAKLQHYMFTNRIISPAQYIMNCLKRFVVQVMLPNKIRKCIFIRFARDAV